MKPSELTCYLLCLEFRTAFSAAWDICLMQLMGEYKKIWEEQLKEAVAGVIYSMLCFNNIPHNSSATGFWKCSTVLTTSTLSHLVHKWHGPAVPTHTKVWNHCLHSWLNWCWDCFLLSFVNRPWSGCHDPKDFFFLQVKSSLTICQIFLSHHFFSQLLADWLLSLKPGSLWSSSVSSYLGY